MASAIETLLATLFPDSHIHYRLAASLDGHRGPVNTLAFNTSATLLASGGLLHPSLYRDARKKKLNAIRGRRRS